MRRRREKKEEDKKEIAADLEWYTILQGQNKEKPFRVEELTGDTVGTANIFPFILQVILNLCPSPKTAMFLIIFCLALELRGFHFFFLFYNSSY